MTPRSLFNSHFRVDLTNRVWFALFLVATPETLSCTLAPHWSRSLSLFFWSWSSYFDLILWSRSSDLKMPILLSWFDPPILILWSWSLWSWSSSSDPDALMLFFSYPDPLIFFFSDHLILIFLMNLIFILIFWSWWTWSLSWSSDPDLSPEPDLDPLIMILFCFVAPLSLWKSSF